MHAYLTKKFHEERVSGFLEDLHSIACNGIIWDGDTLQGSSGLKPLIAAGLVKQTKKGWYVLTTDGIDLCDSLGWIHT